MPTRVRKVPTKPIKKESFKGVNLIPQPDEREIVAVALNEQGYLFQNKVMGNLLPKEGKQASHQWQIESAELPVSLPNGDETRIDIILRHGPPAGGIWRIVMECKRASRDFKKWVFFGAHEFSNGWTYRHYYYGRADLYGSRSGSEEPPLSHRVAFCPASDECPVFEFGVETKIRRPDGSDKKASATEAIEQSLRQVTLGEAALALRLKRAHEMMFRLLPVVITTADLVSAEFDDEKVSLDRGHIQAGDLVLHRRKWLAVNYKVSDVVSLNSQIASPHTRTVADDMGGRQLRTVFVVQAAHIKEFLNWLEKAFPQNSSLH